jgi:capsular polysaccharide transport system permease protein
MNDMTNLRPTTRVQKPVVVKMPAAPRAPRADAAEAPARRVLRRLPWTAISIVLLVLCPTLLAGVYFGLFASDRYATELRLAVRGQNVQAIDTLGIMTTLGGPSQIGSDSYIVVDYLLSREVVDQLQEKVDLRKLYSAPEIDYLSRLDPEAPVEDLVDYWESMTKADYDATRGITTVEISAYRPEDAELIAGEVLRIADDMVNRLSEKARADALRYAQEEVKRAEVRVKEARLALKEFRERNQIADPVRSAGSTQEKIAVLETELGRIEAEIASLRDLVAEGSPRMQVLQAQRKAIEAQIQQARNEISGEGAGKQDSAVASILSVYEGIEVERQFAETAYTTALASLERARAEADRTQRYLAVFVAPKAAEEASYPKRIRNTILVALASFLAWAIGLMFVYGVREHMV